MKRGAVGSRTATLRGTSQKRRVVGRRHGAGRLANVPRCQTDVADFTADRAQGRRQRKESSASGARQRSTATTPSGPKRNARHTGSSCGIAGTCWRACDGQRATVIALATRHAMGYVKPAKFVPCFADFVGEKSRTTRLRKASAPFAGNRSPKPNTLRLRYLSLTRN